jgi:hypothetical protein
MSAVDKRHVLDDEVFSFFASKDGKVFISWCGRQAKTLSGQPAQKFLQQITSLDHHAAQLVMAKITGNFKRGNER